METNLGVAQIWLEEAHENNLTPASEQMLFTLQLSLSLRNPPSLPPLHPSRPLLNAD